jgi:hypothetical protein
VFVVHAREAGEREFELSFGSDGQVDDPSEIVRDIFAAIEVAGIRDDGKGRLFRSAIGHTGALTAVPMHGVDGATGITVYLEAGGTLEDAQAMAAHESPRTTKLYDRTGDEITLDEAGQAENRRVLLLLAQIALTLDPP